jgi:hypothetical protein
MSPTADWYERSVTETVMIDVDVVRDRARQIRMRVREATEAVEAAVSDARRIRGDDSGAFGLANSVSSFSTAFVSFVAALGQECEEIAKALDTVADDAQSADRKS